MLKILYLFLMDLYLHVACLLGSSESLQSCHGLHVLNSKQSSFPAAERRKKVLSFKFHFRMYFFHQHSSSVSALPSSAAAVLK